MLLATPLMSAHASVSNLDLLRNNEEKAMKGVDHTYINSVVSVID